MNGREKSNSAEVAVKPANKTGMPAAEQVEPRAGTEGNAIPQSTSRTQGRADASQARDRIRVRATWSSYATPTTRSSASSSETDARRFLDAMRERLAAFALTLHPDKTRLIEFGRYAAANRERRGLSKPETFKFLGFIFICGKSRKGGFLLKRKSRGDRMRAKLKEIKEGLRKRMHEPLSRQGKWLGQVVQGWFNYHAVPTNFRVLSAFRFNVVDLWRRSLGRRSQKDVTTWERIESLAREWLPPPKILHPWPSD